MPYEPDFERFWNRIRGPRPEGEPEAAAAPEPAPRTVMEQFRDDMEKTMAGDLWASIIMVGEGGQPVYGPRFRVAEKGPVEDGTCDLHIVLPQAQTEMVVQGAAVWESPTAVQALAITDFTTGQTVIRPGDTMELNLRIKVS